uniref:D-xylose 1-dehydrogenase (NADP(+), D-xylono-1,5-lactone-forming) n=1 Tax=Chromera velia CCMP2878 TaxID=1169474 RepID=A0A0G4IDY6_9ALVE|eukprot:Cvel_13436.t1-p1 / transcript=Cvel_13436.t1 / gene=Cvel_13436 / organism=Chromera_velia_CCMP2878 / gene_product=Trans-1,2-dihydrobenzene-1,2-diol dehydrogenase, putative / transcript_product=Trans-1,2-dihydrobenzene-1,2-diol dehydrogenase, putative / location=Cvel_scaffold917:29460-30512(-) / protein_length=351 / sequence_SO=supercontig / SO=protein_coding / is_pseudo=false
MAKELRPSTVRWGFVGTGNIAQSMAEQLSFIPEASKKLICSASGKPPAEIEEQRVSLGFAKAVALDDLMCDPEVDVVYVASANTAHAEHCIAALRRGKHVLCEKPLAISAAETRKIVEVVKASGKLLMDGTFQAYMPGFEAIRSALHKVGTITHVELHKKIKRSIMESSPIINSKALGGGLFDGCGSYTAHALCEIFGADKVASLRPEDVEVESKPGPDGETDWDTTVTVYMRHDDVTVPVLMTHRAVEKGDPVWRSFVKGCNGTLSFDLPKVQSVDFNGEAIEFDDSGRGSHAGLGVEARALHQAIAEGVTGAGVAALPEGVIQAMAHVMELVRCCIPTHLLYSGSVPQK